MSAARNSPANALTWTMESAPAAITRINGRDYLYFAGTGYLGLQANEEVVAAAIEATRQYGVHSATTRAGFGTTPPVRKVEQRAADFFGSEAGCYLVSGYAGNFAIAAAIADGVDAVLVDEASHDCLREAIRWLGPLRHPPRVFHHCEVTQLAELLNGELAASRQPLVMTDGVFAASGRLAPLGEYLTVLRGRPGAMLLVDDAHGAGVLGSSGRGSLELAGVRPGDINALHERGVAVYQSTTLSKALGGHGGLIAGSAEFLAVVRRASGWFRGASAPAAPVAAATAKALEIVQTRPALREQLAANVRQLRSALSGLGLDVEDTPSAIVSFELPGAQRMKAIQSALLDEGIAIGYTRDYAGAPPDGMLRIAVFATHTPTMIDRLVDALRRVL